MLRREELRRRSLVALAALALSLTIAPIAAADEGDLASTQVRKGDFNSYIVLLQEEPLVITHGDDLNSSSARNRGQQLKASHTRTMRETGLNPNKIVNDYTAALNGFSALISHQEAERIAADKDVLMVLPDELNQPLTDASGDYLGLTGPGSAYDSGITGKGVVVGIIDT